MYRQFNGGNFYISVKQLLDSERKIRVLNILQERILTSAQSLTEDLNLDKKAAYTPDVSWLVKDVSIQCVSIDDLTFHDGNILYFVAGYIGRSISRERKCIECKRILLADNKCMVAEVDDNIDDQHKHLFDEINRGSLSAPNDILFAICAFGMLSYLKVRNHEMNQYLTLDT